MIQVDNFERAREEADQRLPLRQVLEQRGAGPASGGTWKSFKCPFCGEQAAGLFERGGREWFKCFHNPCPAGQRALDQAKFIALKTGWSERDAFLAWLKEAGVSVTRRARTRPESASPSSVPPPPGGTDAPAPEPEPPQTASAGAQASGALREPEPPSAPDPSTGSSEPRQPEVRPASAGDSAAMEEEATPLAALREFYAAAAPLSGERLAELWSKRGLTPEMVAWAGLKLSCPDNAAILLQMAQRYPPAVLVRAGLFTVRRGESLAEARPNAQLCGFGFIAPRRDAHGRKTDEWETGWIDPVLIPYFDEQGDLVHLRPHRGMLRDERTRLFVARPSRAWRETHPALPGSDGSPGAVEAVVVAEGEFKALAVTQGMNAQLPGGHGGYTAVAVCGISNAKNWFVAEALEDLLAELQPKTVAIVYDNEEKGDPQLPGFTPNKWNRHDAIVWARYLAIRLARQSHPARVGRLPDEWRDSRGKADWDSALARLAQSDRTPADQWGKVAATVRAAFLRVLKEARTEAESGQLEMFPPGEAFLIERKLAQICYEPKLPYGDDREKRLVVKLRRLVRDLRSREARKRQGVELSGRERCVFGPAVIASINALASAYEATAGCYYILKPPPWKDNAKPDANTLGNWRSRQAVAKGLDDQESAWACALAIDGTPEVVSDFYLRPQFLLRRPNKTQDRYVRITGLHGSRTDLVPWDAKAFAHPRDFRCWLANQGAFAWFAGEKELEMLQTDTNADTSNRQVNEIPYFGQHAESGLWLFDDGAVDPEGHVHEPDKSGVIWYEGEGYRIGERDMEDQAFLQGRPRLRPGQVVVQDPQTLEFESVAGPTQDAEVLRSLFGEFESRLFETIGGFDAWVALGSMLSYAAMPEIFAQHGSCGAPWFHGETNQGKSSVARWLMMLWGFCLDAGLSIKRCTDAGLAVLLNQYSNLPVWLEEYKRDVPESRAETIKNCYNREGGAKFAPGGQRRVRTNPVITGETTSSDAATRSRYPHIMVSSSRRARNADGTLVNHVAWFQRHARRVGYALGRHVLQKRQVFAADVLRELTAFLEDPMARNLDHRTALVYGSAYAGFAAMHRILGGAIYPEQRLAEFRRHAYKEASLAVEEVRSRVNVEVFLQEVVNAVQGDEFGGLPSDLGRFFRAESEAMQSPPGAPDQGPWRRWVLYILPGPVFNILSTSLRRQGRTLILDRGDTQAQLSQRPYWVAGPNLKRFTGSSSPSRCWGIDLDLCPELGYRPCPTDQVEASRSRAMSQQSSFVPVGEWDWSDPRRGPLYGVVERLTRKEHLDTEERADR